MWRTTPSHLGSLFPMRSGAEAQPPLDEPLEVSLRVEVNLESHRYLVVVDASLISCPIWF